MKNILREHDALGLADLVRRREVSPVELLDTAIAETETLQPRFNFLARPHFERARATVAKGLPEGPFTGVPFLLKDLSVTIEGEVTGQGSRYFADDRATATSELVRRQERAGLVIFGKTTTPEFGLTGTTESKATGATRNPWNPEHSTGGSSGGSGAAVALGIVPMAHATDGGGSIRIPASCCGLFGLKPSRGRVPIQPSRTESWSGLSVHHAVTRSVRDSAALLDATQGPEPGGRFLLPAPERPFLEEAGRDPGRLRIALHLQSAFGTPVDPECLEATRAAARLLESLGHHVEEASPVLDAAALGLASQAVIAPSVALNVEDRKARCGIEPGPDTLEALTLSTYRQGLQTSAIDYTRGIATFRSAAATIDAFMERYDIILSPTLGTPPPKLGVLGLSPDDIDAYYAAVVRFVAFTQLQNQTGQPGMSLPLAMSASGLPIGVMASARLGEEALLFRLAGQIERAAPWADRRPRLAA